MSNFSLNATIYNVPYTLDEILRYKARARDQRERWLEQATPEEREVFFERFKPIKKPHPCWSFKHVPMLKQNLDQAKVQLAETVKQSKAQQGKLFVYVSEKLIEVHTYLRVSDTWKVYYSKRGDDD